MQSLPFPRAKPQTRLIFRYAGKIRVLGTRIVTVLWGAWGTEVLVLIWILRGDHPGVRRAQRNRIMELLLHVPRECHAQRDISYIPVYWSKIALLAAASQRLLS